MGCDTDNCLASGPLVPPAKVLCPVSAGKTCTFSILVQAGLSGSPVDSQGISYVGDGKFVVNNTNPTYDWQPTGFTASGVSQSYSFVVVVKNTSANQSHPVEIDLDCRDQDGGGCNAFTPGYRYDAQAFVRTDVFVPQFVGLKRDRERPVCRSAACPDL